MPAYSARLNDYPEALPRAEASTPREDPLGFREGPKSETSPEVAGYFGAAAVGLSLVAVNLPRR